MGVFEFSNFERGTREVARIIAQATSNGTFSIVGGGEGRWQKKDFAGKISFFCHTAVEKIERRLVTTYGPHPSTHDMSTLAKLSPHYTKTNCWE